MNQRIEGNFPNDMEDISELPGEEEVDSSCRWEGIPWGQPGPYSLHSQQYNGRGVASGRVFTREDGRELDEPIDFSE